MRSRYFNRPCLVVLTVAFAGCGGGGDNGGGMTTPSRTITAVAISGSNMLTVAGETSQLSARAQFSTGSAEDVTQQAAWSSSNGAVASVTAGGLVTAVAAGAATISASYQNVTGTQGVSVASAPLQLLSIEGATVLTTRSQTSQLTARARLADGSTQDVTATAAWSVADTSIATIVPGAVLTAANNGLSEVVATFQGQRATRTVETRWSDCQAGGTKFHINGVSQTPRTALAEQGCQTCHAPGQSAAKWDFTRSPAEVYNTVLLLVRPRDLVTSRLAQFGQTVPGHSPASTVNSCYPGSWCGDLIRRWISEGACAP